MSVSIIDGLAWDYAQWLCWWLFGNDVVPRQARILRRLTFCFAPGCRMSHSIFAINFYVSGRKHSSVAYESPNYKRERVLWKHRPVPSSWITQCSCVRTDDDDDDGFLCVWTHASWVIHESVLYHCSSQSLQAICMNFWHAGYSFFSEKSLSLKSS